MAAIFSTAALMRGSIPSGSNHRRYHSGMANDKPKPNGFSGAEILDSLDVIERTRTAGSEAVIVSKGLP